MGKLLVINSTDKNNHKFAFSYLLSLKICRQLPKAETCLIISQSENGLLEFFNISSEELSLEDCMSYRMVEGINFKLFDALPKKNNLYFLRCRYIPKACFNKYRYYYKAVLEELISSFSLIIADVSNCGDSYKNAFIEMAQGYVTMIEDDEINSVAINYKKMNPIAYIQLQEEQVIDKGVGIKEPEEASFGRNGTRIFKIKNILNLDKIIKKGNLDKLVLQNTVFNHSTDEIVRFISTRMALKEDNPVEERVYGNINYSML